MQILQPSHGEWINLEWEYYAQIDPEEKKRFRLQYETGSKTDSHWIDHVQKQLMENHSTIHTGGQRHTPRGKKKGNKLNLSLRFDHSRIIIKNKPILLQGRKETIEDTSRIENFSVESSRAWYVREKLRIWKKKKEKSRANIKHCIIRGFSIKTVFRKRIRNWYHHYHYHYPKERRLKRKKGKLTCSGHSLQMKEKIARIDAANTHPKPTTTKKKKRRRRRAKDQTRTRKNNKNMTKTSTQMA